MGVAIALGVRIRVEERRKPCFSATFWPPGLLKIVILGQGSVATEYGKQEFVLHFVERYDSEAPIWAATEFMTMGCMVSLLDLMEVNLKEKRHHQFQ